MLAHKFSLTKIVEIIEISQRGTIREIRISNSGISYLVTYWWDGKLQEVWLWEHELKEI